MTGRHLEEQKPRTAARSTSQHPVSAKGITYRDGSICRDCATGLHTDPLVLSGDCRDSSIWELAVISMNRRRVCS